MRAFTGIILLFVLFASACADRTVTELAPNALDVGTPKTMFAATTRAPTAAGGFGPTRGEGITLLETTVSIPPNHQAGELRFSYSNPDPNTQFTMVAEDRFDSDAAFRKRLHQHANTVPSASREATIFIHGFNSTHAESAFRAAQIANDISLSGTSLYYSWPSWGKPLGYAYDIDSVFFARDGLEHLVRQVQAADVGPIILVAHSLGSVVLMETLRQIEIATPGWAEKYIAGVVLISPDLDIELFKTQMSRIGTPPDPFLIFASERDSILNLSRRLRGTHTSERLGNIQNLSKVDGLPITIIDTTDFAADAESGHFIPATSPALLSMLNSAAAMTTVLNRERLEVVELIPGNVVQSGETREVQIRYRTGDDR